MKYGSKIKFLIFLNFSLIILDRFSKWFVLKFPNLYQGSLIELKLFKNPKIYFISFDSLSLYFLIGATIILLLFLFFKACQRKNSLLTAGFTLIILGGLSNFLDRIIFGYVIDWIRVFFLPISFFNIADLIVIGGILCLIFALIKSR